MQDPAREAIFVELSRLTLDTYGEERSAEPSLQAQLEAAATAVWRVMSEPLDLTSTPPFSTHD